MKIPTSRIVGFLDKHISGDREMSATQIAAAKILLSKTLPDLSESKSDVNVSTGPWHDVVRALQAKK